jgi:hypothetical protein
VEFTLKSLRRTGPEPIGFIYNMDEKYPLNKSTFGEPEDRQVHVQARYKSGSISTVFTRYLKLKPMETIHTINGKNFWTEAKKRGFQSHVIKCYPESMCNSEFIDGIPINQEQTSGRPESALAAVTEGKTHFTGGKFDFDIFTGKNLKNGWSLYGMETFRTSTKNFAGYPMPGTGHSILSSPNQGSRNLRLAVRIWANSTLVGSVSQIDPRIRKRRCWFFIRNIWIKGPNCQSWVNAFE